jgi:hypothetical protein
VHPSAAPPAAAQPGPPQAGPTRAAPSPTTTLRLSVPYRTAYGHHLAIVGDDPALGSWAPERAVPMDWSEGDVWVAEVGAGGAPGDAWEYKYIVREGERALDWSQVRVKGVSSFCLPLSLSRQRTNLHSFSFSLIFFCSFFLIPRATTSPFLSRRVPS